MTRLTARLVDAAAIVGCLVLVAGDALAERLRPESEARR